MDTKPDTGQDGHVQGNQYSTSKTSKEYIFHKRSLSEISNVYSIQSLQSDPMSAPDKNTQSPLTIRRLNCAYLEPCAWCASGILRVSFIGLVEVYAQRSIYTERRSGPIVPITL